MNSDDKTAAETTPGNDVPAGSSESPTDELPSDGAKPTFGGGLNCYPPYRSKIDDMLREEHRADYERLIAGKTSVSRRHAWLRERGYKVGRCTVDRHRMNFAHQVRLVRQGAETAAT